MSERIELICDFGGNNPGCSIFLSQYSHECFLFNINLFYLEANYFSITDATVEKLGPLRDGMLVYQEILQII